MIFVKIANEANIILSHDNLSRLGFKNYATILLKALSFFKNNLTANVVPTKCFANKTWEPVDYNKHCQKLTPALITTRKQELLLSYGLITQEVRCRIYLFLSVLLNSRLSMELDSKIGGRISELMTRSLSSLSLLNFF